MSYALALALFGLGTSMTSSSSDTVVGVRLGLSSSTEFGRFGVRTGFLTGAAFAAEADFDAPAWTAVAGGFARGAGCGLLGAARRENSPLSISMASSSSGSIPCDSSKSLAWPIPLSTKVSINLYRFSYLAQGACTRWPVHKRD